MKPAPLVISKGRANVTPLGLRCQGQRSKQPDQACNKLLCKRNADGQIAGSFKCERCGQVIDVAVRLTGV